MGFENIIFWGASFLSLLGAWGVGKDSTIRQGFICWMVSNPVLAYSSYTTGSYYMTLMFLIFFIFAVRGLVNEG